MSPPRALPLVHSSLSIAGLLLAGPAAAAIPWGLTDSPLGVELVLMFVISLLLFLVLHVYQDRQRHRTAAEAQREALTTELRMLNRELESQVNARTQEIRRAAALQQAIMSNAGFALIVTDTVGAITEFNCAAERLLGYRAAEVVGGTTERFHDPAEIEARARELSAETGRPVAPGMDCFLIRAARGTPDEQEWTFVRRDGQRIPVLLSISALRDAGRQLVGYIGMAVSLSARKRLERALTVERDRFRTIFDLAPGAILTINDAGLIESANARAETIFGYSRAELLGQPAVMLADPAEFIANRGQIEAYFDAEGGAPPIFGRAVEAVHKDGHRLPVDLRLSKFHGEDRARLIAVVTDRSEQQMLADSEQRWRTMANSLPHLVWTCAADGAINFYSQQFCAYAGISPDWPLGKVGFDLVHPDDRDRVYSHWRECVRTGTELRTDYRVRRHDGVYRWFEARGTPLRDSQGQVLMWVGASTDIEDRKRAEAQIRELNATLERRIEERTELLEAARRDLQSTLDALPSVVSYWDREGRLRFANRAFRVWFGLDAARFEGMTRKAVLGPQLQELNEDHGRAALRGEPRIFENQMLGPDGTKRTFQIQFLPDGVSGAVRGYYAIAHDITEVRRAQAAAEAASASKSTFLANMSHEIRTPMNAVLGMLQLLQRSRLAPEQLDYVTEAASAGRTLMSILNDILDFSKIEAGKLELDLQPFALSSLLHEIGVMLATSRAGKPIEIVFDIDPAVPRELIGDALRLQQILINLGGNALKFTERGEVLVKVGCGRRHQNRVEITFSVADTGIGMSERQCQRVFEGFVQAEATTTRRYGGTGLGLAISQRLAVLMGGELHVASRLGQGTTFEFTLGFDLPDMTTTTAPDPRLLGLRLLLVESHPAARSAVTGFLRQFNWTVESFADCLQAQAAAEAAQAAGKPHHALLMDWPRTDLTDLEQLLRHCTAPLITLVRDVDPSPSGERRHPGGVVPCRTLLKPLTPSMLYDAVAAAHLGPTSPPVRVRVPDRQPLAGLRLLVVEDNPANQRVAQALLSTQGAQVSLVSTGSAGVEAVRMSTTPFDAVLMDLQMPDLDGYAATRLIRALPQGARLPIIAMTANAMTSDREACLEAGMNEHVGKPFELQQLVSVILRFTRRLAADDHSPAVARKLSDVLIDRAGAIARLGGDQQVYREAATDFLRQAPDMLRALSEPDEAVDGLQRQRIVHTLKGLAGTVGAERLRGCARRAEQALRDNGFDEFRERELGALTQVLAETVQVLSATLADAPAAPLTSEPGDPPLSEATFDELEQLLHASNGRALAVFAALDARHRAIDPEGFRRLGAAIEALDFAAAARASTALRASLRAASLHH